MGSSAGRVLGADIMAPVDLPPFDNSAVDGYAVCAGDVAHATADNAVSLQVIAEQPAGGFTDAHLSTGRAIRVFTGSPLPGGADAVVMQEDTKRIEETVKVLEAAKPWENVRLHGEDVKAGERLLAQGTRLGAAQLGLMAASGIATIEAGRQPLVGLLSTGNELCEAGAALTPGGIYESNRTALAALASAGGANVRQYPIVADTAAATRAALVQACDECDVVITSGGVSVGEHDHVKAAFEGIGGAIDFWRIAMRPGKPFVFGKRQNVVLFGLPGNPVSAFVTFILLVRPALLRLQGAVDTQPRQLTGWLAGPVTNRSDRRHFMRVILHNDGTVTSASAQASHMLRSMADANALLDLAPCATIASGTPVKVLPW